MNKIHNIRNNFILFILVLLLSSGCSPRIREMYFFSDKPFFKKMVGVVGNHYTCYIYVQKKSKSDDISVFFDTNLKTVPFEFYGTVNEDGEVYLAAYLNGEVISITGEFKDESTLVLDTRRWGIFKKNVIEFKTFEKNYKIVPQTYYSEILYRQDSSYFYPAECDSFMYHYSLKNYKFENGFPSNFSRTIDSMLFYTFFYDMNSEEDTLVFEVLQPQTLDVEYDVMFFEQGFITLRLIHDFFQCGAAHNVYNVHYINYDTKIQKVVKLNDIYPRKILYEIRELCKRKMKIQYDKSDEELVDFDLPKNYAFLKNGILFQFQAYEFGPYVEGLKSIFISYSEIPKIQY